MKIGIIGGGAAGLACAWLLEKNFKVMLFEKLDRLGGNVKTEYVNLGDKTIPIETAFEFFNSFNYPYFCNLLKILKVPTSSYLLTSTYYTSNKDDLLALPIFQEDKINWASLSPSNLFKLIQFKYLILKARSFVTSNNRIVTLEEFANNLFLTKDFKDNFFYPFLSAGWGDTLDAFKKCAAYDILSWLVKNEPNKVNNNMWYEIPAGTTSYINALVDQLSTVNIKLSVIIKSIYPKGEKGYLIIQDDGTESKVDHLIIATNADQAAKLLSNIPSIQELQTSLSKIEYFHTTIAIHGDERLMPADKLYWSVANVYFDGTYSNLTTYKSWKSDTPIFRSWITPNIAKFNPPNPLYATEHFFHSKVNSNYFRAQEIIKRYQGINNIWIAGIYVNDMDAHESAIVSAINIAKKLAPKSSRLKKLVKHS